MATFTAYILDGKVAVSGESWVEVQEGVKFLGLDPDTVLPEVPWPWAGTVLRTPPEIDPIDEPVVQSSNNEAKCQECGDDLAPLTAEQAVEMFGLRVCVSCGQQLQ